MRNIQCVQCYLVEQTRKKKRLKQKQNNKLIEYCCNEQTFVSPRTSYDG